MTTDELIQALREQTNTNGCWNDGRWSKCKRLMNEAADRLEEQSKIIKQYQNQKADCFLAAHGWEWEEGGSWYDD